MKIKKQSSSTSRSEIDLIRKKLGRLTHEWAPRIYLNTGNTFLNSVLGQEDKGLVYGKIIEIAGMPSNGKSALAIDIAAVAQADGAHVVWIDHENSFDQPRTSADESWPSRRGLACSEEEKKFYLIKPYVGKFKGESESRLSTAQELMEEAEAIMSVIYLKDHDCKIVIVNDSVAAMLPEDEAASGLSGQNFKTSMSLPVMLGHLMRRWTGILQQYNAMAIFINQLRHKPMAFGDPVYTPGGNAIPFYAHVRVRVKRVKGGRIIQKNKSDKMIGVRAVIKNIKNKAGGVEGAECGCKILFNGTSKFVAAKDVLEEV